MEAVPEAAEVQWWLADGDLILFSLNFATSNLRKFEQRIKTSTSLNSFWKKTLQDCHGLSIIINLLLDTVSKS